MKVTPGEVLYFTVGNIPTTNCYTASYNASDIRIGGTAYSNRVVVAGGGGSGCFCNRSNNNGAVGGNGGGTTGATGGANTKVVGGGGGTQSKGGASGYCTDTAGTTGLGKSEDGKLGLGGNGKAYYRAIAYSGAGGAGYYGGGSGGGYEYFGSWTSGGGGGSSYANPNLCSKIVHTQGFNNGVGYIIIKPIG